MRARFVLVPLLLIPAALFAADLQITVSDPQSARVTGARVSLYHSGTSVPIAVATTAGEGIVEFRELPAGRYRVEVLAAGFAPQTTEVTAGQDTTLPLVLAIAVPAQTVMVTATRSPAPLGESGAAVTELDTRALSAMQSVTASDALRFMTGALVNTAGQRGGIASLFVRGGESRYNKVIVDGVPINEPGGVFDFGVVPMYAVDRIEMLRGPGSVLYGSDAMTSVVQFWTASGHTATPELRFGAEGGTFATARGYASLAGARGRFDYNLLGEQFNTAGQGINDDYGNSAQGVNLGVQLTNRIAARLRLRHANSRAGVQNGWLFNGVPRLAPDVDAFARQNNLLASAAITVAQSPRWQHRFTGYEYSHRGLNRDTVPDRGCDPANFNFLDCFFSALFSINRAGFEYQGDYAPRDGLRSTFGYDFEDEHGVFDSRFEGGTGPNGVAHTPGLRRNHALYAEQQVVWRRFSLVGGARYVHNENFGNKLVPQVTATVLAARGGQVLSGTRLHASFAEGIQEPSFQESFGITGTFPTNPNPDLRPEQNRAFDAGFEQLLFGGKASLDATYFHNRFRDQIAFTSDPETFIGRFVNVNEALAHGAEVGLHARVRSALMLNGGYTYLSTQVLKSPFAADPLLQAGAPLLRRPRHSGTLLLVYSGLRWGGDIGGTFIGRRADSDFLGLTPAVTHAAGYARVDLGGWYAVSSRVSAYVQLGNALNRRYEEVVGYPALKANWRAGMRFRLGGD